jgi:hypothetical protein
MNDFEGGILQVKFKVLEGKLSLDYSTDEGKNFNTCILSKGYAGLKQIGYVGVTSGNPVK